MKLIFIILLVLFIALQMNIWVKKDGYSRMKEYEDLVTIQANENEEMLILNNRLKEEIEDLKNGKEAIEEKARIDIGMIKEGEEFYLINDSVKEGETE